VLVIEPPEVFRNSGDLRADQSNHNPREPTFSHQFIVAPNYRPAPRGGSSVIDRSAGYVWTRWTSSIQRKQQWPAFARVWVWAR